MIARRFYCIAVMPFQPTDFRRKMARIGDDAGDIVKSVCVDTIELGAGAAVHPGKARSAQSAALIDRNAAVKLTANGKASDLPRICVRFGKGIGNGGTESVLPEPWILFGSIRFGKGGVIEAARRTLEGKRRIGHRRFEALCADIDADQHRS